MIDVLPDPKPVWPELAGEPGGFHGRQAVELAAAWWPSHPTTLDHLQATIKYPAEKLARKRAHINDDGDEILSDEWIELVPRRRASIVIAPGLITVKVASSDETDHNGIYEHPDDCVCPPCAEINEEVDAMLDFEDQGDDDSNGGIVRGFSARAKGRLMRHVASIDWVEAIGDGERLAMVTLTYPDNWRDVAPTPEACIAHLDTFSKRFDRATGTKLRCVWVREFQKRGAPHFHLAMAIPDHVNGQPFRLWLSRAWYDTVKSGDPKHLQAGTNVEYDDALRSTDPKRLAAYFAGYTQKGKEKGYQHEPPAAWGNENGSVGGFWGARGLAKATAEAALSTDDEIIEVKRILRRMIHAQKRTATKRIARGWETRYIPSTPNGENHVPASIIDQDRYDRLTTKDQAGYHRVALADDDGNRHTYGWLPKTTETISQEECDQLRAFEWRTWTPVQIPTGYRTVNRRWSLRSLNPTGPKSDPGRGFSVFVNNGPQLAIQLAQHLHPTNEPWPKGEARPLP